MNRILLLLDRAQNQRLLIKHLGTDYQVIVPEELGEKHQNSGKIQKKKQGKTENYSKIFETCFDLCIIDEATLSSLWPQIEAKKAAAKPEFLPFLLIKSGRFPKSVSGVRELSPQQLRQSIDDLLEIAPLDSLELHLRIENLLVRRQLSLELQAFTKKQTPTPPSFTKGFPLFLESIKSSKIGDRLGQLLKLGAIARELTSRVQIDKQLFQVNRDLQLSIKCNQVLVRDSEELELLRDICQIIVEVGGYHFAAIAYSQSESNCCEPVLQTGYQKDVGKEAIALTPVSFELSKAVLQTGIPYISQTEAQNHQQQKTETAERAIALPLLQKKESRLTTEKVKDLIESPGVKLDYSDFEADPNHICFGVLNISTTTESQAFKTETLKFLLKLANDLAYGIIARRSQRERQQTEEALQKREQQLRAIFDCALEAMAIADTSGQYLEVNPAACELFGLPQAELLRHTVGDFAEPTIDFQQAWASFLKQGQIRGEFRLCRLDGTVRDVEFAAKAEFLPDRHLSLLRDITPRKQAEAQLQQYHQHLEELVEERTAELQQEITSRVRVEAALRESSQQLRTLINAMPDIVCFKDGAGQWLEANQAMLEVFELEAIDYQGKTDIELAGISNFYLEAFLTCDRTDRKTWEQRSLYQSEEAIPKRDGIFKIYDVIKVPLFHANGERQGLVILGRDITERKQAEVASVRLAAIVESSDDAIIGKTLEGQIESWNAGAERIYGYSASEVLGRSISILAIAERQGEMPQILESIIAGGSIDHYETVHLRKDGKQIDVSLTICPIKDTAGSLVGVSTIARDISDRKRVETALEQLRHQNELILDSAGDGICGLNRQGKITFVNPAVARMTGYELRELIDRSLQENLYHVEPDRSPDSLEQSQILATLQDGIARRVTDEVFWRKDGTNFAVEYVASPIRDKGEIVGAVVTFKDITESLAVERMKDEFISVVSHELRTPLTSMHGALGLLASGLLDTQPERAKRMLEIAVANTDRLVRLINDILDLERMKSSQEAIAKQRCNVADLMLQAADEMQAMAQMAGVTLSVVPIHALLLAVPDRLIQAFTNLLSNAIKFSPVGTTVWFRGQLGSGNSGPEIPPDFFSVGQLAQKVGDSEILITVTDRGRGIPADKLETIFERFQQVDASDSRQKGGTGLGLAISRSILQHHGGRIWVESTLGKGSTFFLTLPAMQEGE